MICGINGKYVWNFYTKKGLARLRISVNKT